MAEQHELERVTFEDLGKLLGPSWAYNNKELIRSLPVEIPPECEQWFAERLGSGPGRESLDGL